MSKKILAISGSTRQQSTNQRLIDAITAIAGSQLQLIPFAGIDTLPHFNPDLDTEPAPAAVADFRQLIRSSDAVLICTPEYAMGAPGSLKNALDWTVSTADFSGKPVVLITAATSGEKAHASLLGTLKVIEAIIVGELLISFAGAKISKEGTITDPPTLEAVTQLVKDLEKSLE